MVGVTVGLTVVGVVVGLTVVGVIVGAMVVGEKVVGDLVIAVWYTASHPTCCPFV